MSKFFGELQEDFLSKLDKLDFVKYDYSDTLTTADGITVSCTAELNSNGLKSMPVQVIMYVRKDGIKVYHWGSMSNEDNKAMVDWFVSAKVQAQRAEDTAQRIALNMAEKFWENL